MRTIKTGKMIGKLIALLMAAAMIIGLMIIPINANENDVRETAKGVLQIIMKIDSISYSRGSCFLINEDTIITSNHCVHLTQEEYDALYALQGIKKEEADIPLPVQELPYVLRELFLRADGCRCTGPGQKHW